MGSTCHCNCKIAKRKYRFVVSLFDDTTISNAEIYDINGKLLDKMNVIGTKFNSYLPQSSLYYVIVNLSDRGKNMSLFSSFDYESQYNVLSEQTTIANVFCFARFINNFDKFSLSKLDNLIRRTKIAYGMRNNFISSQKILGDITQSPNNLETNSLKMLNFLSNLFYYCLTEQDIYDQFIILSQGNNFLNGLLNLVYNPTCLLYTSPSPRDRS